MGLGLSNHVWGWVVDAVEEGGEDGCSVWLVVLGGVVSLLDEDGDELGCGVEEAAAFADGFEVAVERDGSGAVAVAEVASVVGGEASHVAALDVGVDGLVGVVAGLDGFGDAEVFVGDGAV